MKKVFFLGDKANLPDNLHNTQIFDLILPLLKGSFRKFNFYLPDRKFVFHANCLFEVISPPTWYMNKLNN
jgi:hypothetical protein